MGDWDTAPEPQGLIVIRLKPTYGRFFGQGWHRSTLSFLERMGDLVKPGQRVLDFGTGTGVLAIAAAKLGATVTAVDNDPEALEAAREHCALNGVTDAVEFFDSVPIADYDLILANVGFDPSRELSEFLAPGGVLLWQV